MESQSTKLSLVDHLGFILIVLYIYRSLALPPYHISFDFLLHVTCDDENKVAVSLPTN